MDKYEFNIKVEQIKKLVNKRDYGTAMKIADTIDWRRVRSANLLSMVAEIYENNEEYQEAKEILLLAFERAPIGKRLLYKLAELALKEDSVREAEDYYREFCDLAPDDPRQYLLRYLILKAKKAPEEQLIHSLERYTDTELDEKWMYELAELYGRVGDQEHCVRTCDRIMLMFGLGKYVDKAMELKVQYAPLSSYQKDLIENRDKYEERLRAVQQKYSEASRGLELDDYEEEPVSQVKVRRMEESDETSDGGVKIRQEEDEEPYRTVDEELAASIHQARAEEKVAQEMSRISVEEYHDEETSAERTKILSDMKEIVVEYTGKTGEADVIGETGGSGETDAADEADGAGETDAVDKAGRAGETDAVGDAVRAGETDAANEVARAGETDAVGKVARAGEMDAVSKAAGAGEMDAADEADGAGETNAVGKVDRARETDVTGETGENHKMAGKVKPAESAKSTDETDDIPAEHLMIEARTPDKGLSAAVEALKQMHKERGTKRQVVKITGSRLSERGVLASADKMAGKDLLIDEAGDLTETALDELKMLIMRDHTGMTVVLVDNPRQMDSLRSMNPGLASMFCLKGPDRLPEQNDTPAEEKKSGQHKAAVHKPVHEAVREENDGQDAESGNEDEPYEESYSGGEYKDHKANAEEELELRDFVEYASKYASDIDCSITGKSMLALYERIEIMEEDGIPLTRANAEDLIEEAADKAEKFSVKKVFTGWFAPKYDKEGLLILREEHFMD